jgi:hypothetical protein
MMKLGSVGPGRETPAVLSSARFILHRAWLWILAASRLVFSSRCSAENHADYKYEDYKEDGGRIHIRTHSAMFEASLAPWLTVKGKYVYDGISGATPTGEPAPAGSDQVPTVQIRDIRRAYSLETPLKFGSHGFAPQVAWSRENDYESHGVAGTYTLELNQKNTVLSLGGSHDFDRVSGSNSPQFQDKGKTDVLVGLSQLLGPETIFTANLVLSYSDGYLADPYKVSVFTSRYPAGFPFPPLTPADAAETLGEQRPHHRFDQVVFLSLTHFFRKVNGSLETTGRFQHNDYGIFSQTVSLTWPQKLGASIVASPFFRFYHQSAADFYGSEFPGDPRFKATGVDWENDFGIPGVPRVPPYPSQHFSSDFRLSEMNTFTYGLDVTWKIRDGVSIDAAYKRYVMKGLDGVTSASAYPSANVFTIGLRAWF